MKNHFCTASFAFSIFIREAIHRIRLIKESFGDVFGVQSRRFAIHVPPAHLCPFILVLQALYATESAEHTSLSGQAHSRSSRPSPEPELPLYPLPP